MRFSDETKLSMSVEYKVNLGNYESASVFVCLSGVPVGATEDDIEECMDTAGLAWEIIRDRVRAQADEMKSPKPARPVRRALPVVGSYSDDAKRELSAWARGVGLDKASWAAIQAQLGDGAWEALFKARDVRCSTLKEIMDYCIDSVRPPSIDEYDPFHDEPAEPSAHQHDGAEVPARESLREGSAEVVTQAHFMKGTFADRAAELQRELDEVIDVIAVCDRIIEQWGGAE